MNQVRPACGLPFCSNGEQTNLSIGLRITAIAIGVLAVGVGILTLYNVLGLGHHLGTTFGWSSLSIGILLALLGVSIKLINVEPNVEILNNSPITTPPNQHNSAVDGAFNDGKKYIKQPCPPKNVISKLPEWCAEHLIAAPYFVFKSEGALSLQEILTDIKGADNSPLIMFSRTKGSTGGFYAKLLVQHEMIEPPPGHEDSVNAIPKHEPFFIDVIIWKRYAAADDSRWVLSTMDTVEIQQEDDPLRTKNILGDKHFVWGVETCDNEILDIEEHNNLSDWDSANLAWIAQRLFTKEFFKIYADLGYASHKAHNPRCGYWHISLAPN